MRQSRTATHMDKFIAVNLQPSSQRLFPTSESKHVIIINSMLPYSSSYRNYLIEDIRSNLPNVYGFPCGSRATHEIIVAQIGVKPPNPYTLHI